MAPWSFLPQHAGKEAPCEVGVVAVSLTKPLDHCEHPEMQRVQRLLVEDVVGQQREAAGRSYLRGLGAATELALVTLLSLRGQTDAS